MKDVFSDRNLAAEEKEEEDSPDAGKIQRKTDKEEPSIRYII